MREWMQNNEKINYEDDWKLVSIWIGGALLLLLRLLLLPPAALLRLLLLVLPLLLLTRSEAGNDLCSDGTTAAQYERDLEDTLDFIGTNIPRVFVNMIQVHRGSLLLLQRMKPKQKPPPRQQPRKRRKKKLPPPRSGLLGVPMALPSWNVTLIRRVSSC